MRRLVAFVLVAQVSLAACSHGSVVAAGVVATSGHMPALAGVTVQGAAFGPADYRGRPVVVNFWNPACPPCVREQLALNAAFLALRSRVTFVGIVYVGGDWPDEPAAVRAFIRQFGVGYPVLPDGTLSVAHAFGIAGIPTTVVIDGKGEMRYRALGRIRAGEIEGLVGKL